MVCFSRTFLGHLGGIFCIQQKGDLLVSGSVDKTVCALKVKGYLMLFLAFYLILVAIKLQDKNDRCSLLVRALEAVFLRKSSLILCSSYFIMIKFGFGSYKMEILN